MSGTNNALGQKRCREPKSIPDTLLPPDTFLAGSGNAVIGSVKLTLALLAQWHSGHRVDQFGGLTPLAPADFAQLAAQLRTIMPAWPGP